jgi:hypothetical protein
MLSLAGVLSLAFAIAATFQLVGPPTTTFAADEDLTCEVAIDKTNNTGGLADEGETFTWTIHVEIDEDCNNIDFVVRDNIPTGFDVTDFDDGGLDCDANSDDGDIDCEADNVDGPDSWDILVEVEANGAVCGDRTNTAVIETSDAADKSDNNTVDVSCDLATIKIIKDTNPETSSPSFEFEINKVGGGFSEDFSLEDDESATFHVSAGTYIVEEDSENDWDLVDIDCTGGSSDEDVSDGDVEIEVDENDSVTCTFTNEPEDQQPQLVLIQPPTVIIPQPTARPPAPAPTAVLPAATAPQLPRAGEGPQSNGNPALPIGAGLLAFAAVGLVYWRVRRAR